jgi:hypothetical protein
MAPEVKLAKNSKLPKLPENYFEPVGKGGWPPISTWITIIKFSIIYPMLPFDIGIQSKNSFKDKVSKLSIKNPKTIFPTISILQYLYWTSIVSPCL